MRPAPMFARLRAPLKVASKPSMPVLVALMKSKDPLAFGATLVTRLMRESCKGTLLATTCWPAAKLVAAWARMMAPLLMRSVPVPAWAVALAAAFVPKRTIAPETLLAMPPVKVLVASPNHKVPAPEFLMMALPTEPPAPLPSWTPSRTVSMVLLMTGLPVMKKPELAPAAAPRRRL